MTPREIPDSSRNMRPFSAWMRSRLTDYAGARPEVCREEEHRVKRGSHFIAGLAILALTPLLAGCVWLRLGKSCKGGNEYNASAMHEVKSGETLPQIASDFGTSADVIANTNHIRDPEHIAPGTVLKIPASRITADVAQSKWWHPFGKDGALADAGRMIGLKGEQASARKPAMDVPRLAQNGRAALGGCRADEGGRMPINFVSYEVCARPGQTSPQGFGWPCVGTVSRPFDEKTNHRGLDVCAAEGSPIVAAREGKVIYSGDKLPGYGNMVIVDHGSKLATVYAHNRRNLVSVGQQVKRGQQIAEVGQTGNATTPHVHFEVRKNAQSTDPRPMLP
jgi:lipoprotein NlpD